MGSSLELLSNSIYFDIEELSKIEEKTYPHLYKTLMQYNRYERARQFLKAIKAFKTDTPEDYTDREGRIWIPVPRDNGLIKGNKYIKPNGGGATTWGNVIRMLCVLGLVYPYNPDNHGKKNAQQMQHFKAAYEARKKTEEMNAYYREHREEYPHKSKSHSPNFYFVPRYGKKLLREAEKRAEELSKVSVGYWRKDLVRDALGNDPANKAFDVQYTAIGPHTAKQRETLREAVIARLDANGYFYPADVLNDVLSGGSSEESEEEELEDIFDAYDEPIEDTRNERHFTQTWEQYYRYALLKELGLKLGPPSKADQQQYNLTGNTHIITRQGERRLT